MSLTGSTTEEKIYNFLIKKLSNVYGVCGLMGNLYAESGLNSKNLQNTSNKKLGLTDEEYTQKVDNGTYTNFVKDSAGYGLAQWTYYTRKQSLLDYAKSKGKSIGDLETQLEFLVKELAGYKSVWQCLVGCNSVRVASDSVLVGYEKPANQSESVKKKRAEYGERYYKQFSEKKTEQKGGNIMYSRQKVVDLVNSWIGKKESDGSYKSIIDTYNSYNGTLPRNTKMQYGWAWCACTWSALAIKLGYTAIMPIEISCYYLIERAKKMGCWQEKDNYVPAPGDAILYDWQDSGSGDNTGTPDHVGTVVYVNESAGYFEVVEGNYSDSVKKRTMSINGKFIRGFITPKYDDNTVSSPKLTGGKSVSEVAQEVIAGKWGSGDTRKKQLASAGYDYATVQAKVNEILNGGAVKTTATVNTSTPVKEVKATCAAQKYSKSLAGTYKTTANLYMRNDAGTNKKALVVIPKGTKVKNYGYYSVSGSKWLYVQCTVGDTLYTGFCCGGYLSKC